MMYNMKMNKMSVILLNFLKWKKKAICYRILIEVNFHIHQLSVIIEELCDQTEYDPTCVCLF